MFTGEGTPGSIKWKNKSEKGEKQMKAALTSTVGSWGAVMLGTPENTLDSDHDGEAGVFQLPTLIPQGLRVAPGDMKCLAL